MKSLSRFLCLFVVWLSGVSAVWAQQVTANGVTYSCDETSGRAEVISYEGAGGDLEIRASVEYNGKVYPVTSIGDFAFSGCSGLQEIYISSPTPPNLGTDVWKSKNCSLYVPKGSKQNYVESWGWSESKVIEIGDPTPEPDPDPDPNPGIWHPSQGEVAMELSTAATYILYNPNYTAYAVYNPEHSVEKLWIAEATRAAGGNPVNYDTYTEALDLQSKNILWKIVENQDGSTCLYNLGAGKYLGTPSATGNAYAGFLDEPTPIEIAALGGGGFALRSNTADGTDHLCVSPQHADPVRSWYADDLGASWQFIEVARSSDLGSPEEELKPGMAYALYNPYYTAYAIVNPEYSAENLWVAEATQAIGGHAVSNSAYSEAFDKKSPYGAWQLVETGGNRYLYNIGAGKFLGTPSVTGTEASGLLSAPSPVYIINLSSTSFAISSIANTTYGYLCVCPQLDTPVRGWASDDLGACWQFIENPNVEALAEIPSLTGIDDVLIDEAPTAVYTLTGINLGIVDPKQLPAGIYIRKGKKFMVK